MRGLNDDYFAQHSRVVGGTEDGDIQNATRRGAAVAFEFALSGHLTTEGRIVVVGEHG